MIKNENEVKTELLLLKEIQPKVRAISKFGDNNRKAIESQIKVLESHLSGGNPQRTADHFEEVSDYVYDSARSAVDWINGDQPSLVTGNWDELVEE